MTTKSLFTGRVKMYTSRQDFPNPDARDVRFTAAFKADGSWTVAAGGFTPIVIKDVQTDDVGTIDITIRLAAPAKGTWNAATGLFTLQARFTFTVVLDIDLTVKFDADKPHSLPPHPVLQGQLLDATTGEFALAGEGGFTKFPLAGVKCVLKISGKFEPIPA